MRRLGGAVLSAALLTGLGAGAVATAGPVERGPVFARKVEAFLGGRKGEYILRGKTPVADQVFEALTGPPHPQVTLDDGSTLVEGCRRHSCDEKAAVVVSPQGEVRAVGLIHYACTWDTGPLSPCLTLFVKQDGAYGMALTRWAARATGKSSVPRDQVVVG